MELEKPRLKGHVNCLLIGFCDSSNDKPNSLNASQSGIFNVPSKVTSLFVNDACRHLMFNWNVSRIACKVTI